MDNNSSNNSLYERQIKWREDAKKKAFANSIRDIDETDKELTFKPHIYTTNLKKFEGSAKDINERSTHDHVKRQMKARKEKDSFLSKGNKNSTSLLPIESDPEYQHDEHQDDLIRTLDFENDYYGFPRDEGILSSEESLIEMLERERKESHAERVKLIHCIHLQQIELTQRAVASHEKAAEIAKEFARAIEGFEERLLSIENNVHKEITAIKSIAESLSISSKSNSSQLNNGAMSGNNTSSTLTSNQENNQNLAMMEKRLASLENGIGLIINKLDGITTSINSSHQNTTTLSTNTHPNNSNNNNNNINNNPIIGIRK